MSKIEWTEKTWNPVRGCTRVSPGCENCYAEQIAARFSGGPFYGFAEHRNGKARWTGKVELVPSKLDEPLLWRRPRAVFVNSMSDLFHESLSNEDIAAVWGVMATTPQHVYQILTKRARRMREWLEWVTLEADGDSPQLLVRHHASHASGRGLMPDPCDAIPWPLSNVWLGVSCEDQQRADERIPYLLATPAAVRFVSAEPLLGQVDFGRWMMCSACRTGGEAEDDQHPCGLGESCPLLHWVIVGGESGGNARPMNVEWVRDIVRQCKDAGVACFVKQMGAHVLDASSGDDWPPIDELDDDGKPKPLQSRLHSDPSGAGWRIALRHPKGGDPSEWPAELRVREWPT